MMFYKSSFFVSWKANITVLPATTISIELGLTQSGDVLALSDRIILVSMVMCKCYQIPSVYSTYKPNNKQR